MAVKKLGSRIDSFFIAFFNKLFQKYKNESEEFNIEEYIEIKGHPNYKINFKGEVFSKDKVCFNPRYGYYLLKGKKIKLTLNQGYISLVLDRKPYRLHRIIYETFYGPISKEYIIHHVDRNKLNNNISNLQCITREEHGQIHEKEGLNHYNKKHLSEKLCKQIIQLSEEGNSNRKIAKMLGISKSCVGNRYKKYKEKRSV